MRKKTPEVFKGLREALREGPEGARSMKMATSGRGEEMASTRKSAKGHNGGGDQTLTLIFDSSEE
jgi:hypothetical protein